MPAMMEAISYISSVQHYLVIVRGIMLRGAGLGLLWLPGAALAGIAFTVMALAWLRLRLGLDSNSLSQHLAITWRRLRGCWRRSPCGKRQRTARGKQPEWQHEPV